MFLVQEKAICLGGFVSFNALNIGLLYVFQVMVRHTYTRTKSELTIQGVEQTTRAVLTTNHEPQTCAYEFHPQDSVLICMAKCSGNKAPSATYSVRLQR